MRMGYRALEYAGFAEGGEKDLREAGQCYDLISEIVECAVVRVMRYRRKHRT
jgi:hypothetical protein